MSKHNKGTIQVEISDGYKFHRFHFFDTQESKTLYYGSQLHFGQFTKFAPPKKFPAM